VAEPWPDLKGPCPDDWDPLHWVAVQLIDGEGCTLRVVADRLGKSAGSISRWKRGWKDRYGDDFLAGDRGRSLERAREISADYTRDTVQGWPELRAAAAASNGIAASLSRKLAIVRVEQILADPEQIKLLTVADLFTLVKVADMLERRADELIDVRRGGGRGAANPASGADAPDGFLDGLDVPVGEEASEVFAALAESASTFLHLVTDEGIPADGVIDVEVKKTG